MLSPALCQTVKAVKLRWLLQSSVYVPSPCAAALCSSQGRELSRLLACACCICSARYKNLPVLFLLFYFYTYVFTLCHLEIKAGVCSSAAAALCLLWICCFTWIKHFWGQRLLTARPQVFQPPIVWWLFFFALWHSSCKKYSEIILRWPLSLPAHLSFVYSVCLFLNHSLWGAAVGISNA